jgi:hypothetical protein
VPRLRWPRPKYTPRRGLVSGTRRVRNSKPLPPRDRIERLGKIRGAVVDALEIAGSTLTLVELCEALHRKRPRDVRRRILPMLVDAGILEVKGDVLHLAANWSERLQAARVAGGELEADELAERRRKGNSQAYHRRHDASKARPSAAGLQAVRRSRELREAYLQALPEPAKSRPLSPLAFAIRDYLERHPRDARQPAGWIGSTLWAYELFDARPTPAEAKAAIGELGGAAYLDAKLMEAKGVA